MYILKEGISKAGLGSLEYIGMCFCIMPNPGIVVTVDIPI